MMSAGARPAMEGDMKIWQMILAAAGLAAMAQSGAEAAALTVLNVGAPKINCVFNVSPTASSGW